MGFTYVKIELSNPVDPKGTLGIELPVDTEAILTAVPRKFLEDLGIRPVGKRKLRIFGGKIVEREVGGALIKYNEAYAVIPVVFGEEDDTPILGATGLEALGYQVDPVTKQLKPTELLMV